MQLLCLASVALAVDGQVLYIDLLRLLPHNPAKGKGHGKQQSPVPRWATYLDKVVRDSVLQQAAHLAAFAH